MFLHSGAGLHGHEFSRPMSAQAPRRLPRHIRSAFRPLSEPDASALSQPPPPLPNRRFSQPIDSQLSLSNTFPPPKRTVSVRFTDSVQVMDAEPRMNTLLDDDSDSAFDTDTDLASIEPVERPLERPESIAESAFPPYRKRPSTTFVLARPPPNMVTSKRRRLVQFRPRVLMQLQKMTEARPMPSLDVFPSSLVSGPYIAPSIARKFPRLLRIQAGLGLDDVVLSRSEDYQAPEPGHVRAEFDRRDIMGVISPIPVSASSPAAFGSHVEIALDDDTIWTGFQHDSGTYEFTRFDETGSKIVTARWANRTTRINPDGSPEYKFVFSILDPTSRRHPILAVLRPQRLEIFDSFAPIRKPRSPDDPPLPPITLASTHPSAVAAAIPKPPQIPVDDATRTLITATAVWITLRDRFAWPRPRPFRSGARHRCRIPDDSDRFIDEGTSTPPTEEPPPASPRRPQSLDGRTLTSLSRWTTDADSDDGRSDTLPRRTFSTGAAFMRRRRAVTITESLDEGGGVFLEQQPMPGQQPPYGYEETEVSVSLGGDFSFLVKKKGVRARLKQWGERVVDKLRRK